MYARPAVAGDVVYVFSCSGKVFAADARTGEQEWMRDLALETPGAEMHGQPAIHGTTLFVPVDARGGGALYALDRRTGAILWEVEKEGGFTTDILLAGNAAITITGRGELMALHRKTGRVLWSLKVDAPAGERRLSAGLAGNRVYVTAGSDLLMVDAARGKVLRRIPLGAEPSSSVAAGGGHVMVGLRNRTLRILTTGGRDTATVVLPDAAVAITRSGEGAVLLTSGDEVVAISKKDVLWRFGKGEKWSSPRFAFFRDQLLAGTESGRVVVVDPVTGKVVREFQVKGMARGIAASGEMVIVGTLAGEVFGVAAPR
ncbi:MAG TPA: PQQ-binding-like beta-propeller repeat protein [Thermoanaerobaculia bacterium]